MSSAAPASAGLDLSGVPHAFPYQGSKRLLAGAILGLIPYGTRRLVEPFAGSGAVSIAARHTGTAQSVWLGDLNAPLIGLWREILTDPEGLADAYRRLWEGQAADPRRWYDHVRARFNASGEPALLLYLLNRCVKAAVRYSASGDFNQSADHRRTGARPDVVRSRLVATAVTLSGAQTTVGGYEPLLLEAGPSDVVYLDPPYQGVSRRRDRRYLEGLSRDLLEPVLRAAVEREVAFVLSYDAVTDGRRYGDPLPADLGLVHLQVVAGRSAQATLLGRDQVTAESLYVSPALVDRLGGVAAIGVGRGSGAVITVTRPVGRPG